MLPPRNRGVFIPHHPPSTRTHFRLLQSCVHNPLDPLIQVLAGTDSPEPPPAVVLRALVTMSPSRLLARRVVPSLTDDQAWPLLAAVYSLLVWGQDSPKPSGVAAGRRWPGSAADVHTERGGSASHHGGSSPTVSSTTTAPSDWAKALRNHLQQEVAPVLEELRHQVALAAVRPSPPPLPRARPPQTPTCTPLPAAADVYADASAPLLPAFHLPTDEASTPTVPSEACDLAQSVRTVGAARVVFSQSVEDGPTPSSEPAGGKGDDIPPQDYLCPITTELMVDPVVAADGHSYEREAISCWFAGRPKRPTSPLTGAVLPHTGLTPNYVLRKIILDWQDKHRK